MSIMLEKTKNVFNELLKIGIAAIPIIAITVIVYKIYGYETAYQTIKILVILVVCVLGFDCAIDLIKMDWKEATDKNHSYGSVRKVLKYSCGILIILYFVSQFATDNLKLLYTLKDGNILNIILLALVSIIAVLLYDAITKPKT